MSILLRALSAVSLSLVLALATSWLVAAKVRPEVAQALVICTDIGTEVVFLDAEGAPVAPPHGLTCIDCALCAGAAEGRQPEAERFVSREIGAVSYRHEADITAAASRGPPLGSRAPPALS